jgi:hypothetical protein
MNKDGDTDMDRDTDRDREKDEDREKDREMDRDRETDRKTDRETDMDMDNLDLENDINAPTKKMYTEPTSQCVFIKRAANHDCLFLKILTNSAIQRVL